MRREIPSFTTSCGLANQPSRHKDHPVTKPSRPGRLPLRADYLIRYLPLTSSMSTPASSKWFR